MTSPRIRTMIVDDEPLARKTIRILLREETDIEIVGEAADGNSARAAIRQLNPDLLFLDIKMPDCTGFELLESMREERELPLVVFVTAFDEYAIDAFRIHAVDYLLKPFDDEQFAATLLHAKKCIRQNMMQAMSENMLALLRQLGESGARKTAGGAGEQPAYLVRVGIRSVGRTQYVPVNEIDWMQAEGNYVGLHTGTKTHMLRGTIQELEAGLDPRMFIRIHRSTIVNIDRIVEIQNFSVLESVVKLKDTTTLKVSRNHLRKLREALGHPLG